jgi:hypothetical protein
MSSEHKPKRKYTVSAKVLAANRENLKKALAARKPAGYADDEIVIQQWEEILRLNRHHQAEGRGSEHPGRQVPKGFST